MLILGWSIGIIVRSNDSGAADQGLLSAVGELGVPARVQELSDQNSHASWGVRRYGEGPGR